MFLVLRGQCTIIFIQSESKIEINNDTHRCLEQERSLVEPGAVEPATSCISGSRHPPATMDDVSQQCNGTTEIRSNIMTFSVRISLATIRHLSQCRTVNQIEEVFYFWLTLPHPPPATMYYMTIRQQCKTAIRVSTISTKLAASVSQIWHMRSCNDQCWKTTMGEQGLEKSNALWG